MKCFLPLMISSGFLLSGCNSAVDEQSSGTMLDILASDDAAAVEVSSLHRIEKPELVTEGPLPKAVALKTEYNFGRMALGSKSQTTFEIRNDGESELQLEAGRPTCQCTVFALSAKKLAPGETATLIVSWDAKIVDRSFQHGGPVYTNDPEREALQFVVMGQVGVEYELQPSGNWNAGEASGDEPATVLGVVFSTVNADFEIDRVECETDNVTAEFRKLTVSELNQVKAIRGFEIKVSVVPNFDPGQLKQSIDIYLKGREQPITTVVTARRLGPIRILPTPGASYTDEDSRLRMGTFPSSEGKNANVMLLVDQLDEPLQLTKVTAVPPFVKVELKQLGKGNGRYLLNVAIPAGVQKGFRGTDNPVQIQIETNHPGQKSIAIQVTYRAS